MRRNGEKAKDFAMRHGVTHWFDDAQALIEHPEVDAVYIATPPGSHKEYALRVCAAGKPAYIEKPMARNFVECVEIVEAFEKAQVPLYVAYYRRGLARFLKAKEIVEAGRLGTLTSIRYTFASPAHRNVLEYLPIDSPHRIIESHNLPWRLQAEQAGGGLFLDLGCHTLDILAFMVGDLAEVGGFATNRASAHAVEDTIAMHFCTEEGVPGTALWNFASHAKDDTIRLYGTEGSLSLSTFGNEPVLLETREGTESFDLPNPKHIQQPFIQTIIDDLLGRDKCASTGRTAMRTSWVIDEVLSAYYGGRQDAFWEREAAWRGQTL
jgi:predicted dehydrogenase